MVCVLQKSRVYAQLSMIRSTSMRDENKWSPDPSWIRKINTRIELVILLFFFPWRQRQLVILLSSQLRQEIPRSCSAATPIYWACNASQSWTRRCHRTGYSAFSHLPARSEWRTTNLASSSWADANTPPWSSRQRTAPVLLVPCSPHCSCSLAT